MRFLNGFKKIFKIFRHKHAYLITNAFYTLQNSEQIDIIKTCTICGKKEALSMDKETLLEVVNKFPNAFDSLLRDYLYTWNH